MFTALTVSVVERAWTPVATQDLHFVGNVISLHTPNDYYPRWRLSYSVTLHERGSNPRPSSYKADALPAKIPQYLCFHLLQTEQDCIIPA
jgi:hypothetical protein